MTSGRFSSSSLRQDDSRMIQTMKKLYGHDPVNAIMEVAKQSKLDDTKCYSLIYNISFLWHDFYNQNFPKKLKQIYAFCKTLSGNFIRSLYDDKRDYNDNECFAFVLLLSQLQNWKDLNTPKWRNDKLTFIIQDARNMVISNKRNKIDNFIKNKGLSL